MHADQDDLAALVQAQSFELVDSRGDVIGQWEPDDPAKFQLNPTASLQMLPDQGTLTRPGALRWSFYDPALNSGLGIESDQTVQLLGPTSANLAPSFDPPSVQLSVVNANTATPVNTVNVTTGKATAAGTGPASVVLTTTPTTAQAILSAGANGQTQVAALDKDVLLAPETTTGRVRLGVRNGYVPVGPANFDVVSGAAFPAALGQIVKIADIAIVAGDVLMMHTAAADIIPAAAGLCGVCYRLFTSGGALLATFNQGIYAGGFRCSIALPGAAYTAGSTDTVQLYASGIVYAGAYNLQRVTGTYEVLGVR